MEVKNLFDQSTYQDIVDRLNKLSSTSERQWGKMTAAQMLAHCKEAFKVPLSSKPLSRSTMGILFGWIMKSKLFNTSPWGKNLPTAPNFRIKDERSFEEEKNDLVSIVSNFHKKGVSGIGDKVHPMFGKLTAEQWGLSMWKHLDHHLRQFGV